MSSTGCVSEIPPNDLDVIIWIRILLDLYMQESARGESSRDRMGDLRVLELRHFKRRSSSEHEYIVAKICSQSSYYYLKLDRNVKSADFTSTARSGNRVATIWTTTKKAFFVCGTPLFSSSYQRLAIDTVEPLDSWPDLEEKGPEALRIVNKIRFSDNQPTLLDLAMVAAITHDHSQGYRLFRRQCFWYASVIIQTLRKIAGVEHASEKFGLEEVHDGAAGTWKGFRIARVFPKQTSVVWDSYRGKKPMLMSEILEADRGWKEIAHKAAGYSAQKILKEEALKRGEQALKEAKLAREREKDTLNRIEVLLKEIENLKKL